MGPLSILLSALALVCAGFGVLTSVVPGLGLFFAFGAPALAIIGVMVGGSAMSRAKRSGQVNETARIGVILNVLAFIPGLLVALTCGVCNAMFSTGNMQLQRDIHFGAGGPDAGAQALPPPQWLGGAGAASPAEPPAGQPDPNVAPGATNRRHTGTPQNQPSSAAPSQPEPAPPGGSLPPPPLPAGPRR